MNSISDKQSQIDFLQKQIALLKTELCELEELNPQYKQTYTKLLKKKNDILKKANQPKSVIIKDFIEFKCVWQGIELYPKIIESQFLVSKPIDDLLKKVFFDYNLSDELFDIENQEIKSVLGMYDSLDEEIKEFNNSVEKEYNKFGENNLKKLIIENLC